MIFCRSCEQLVPGGSLYCPHCCGEDGRRGAFRRGAFIGGVFGLLAGGLSAAVWSSIVGPEQATGELVLAITLACAAMGHRPWGDTKPEGMSGAEICRKPEEVAGYLACCSHLFA
jgi:hypothetical protein